MGVPSRPVRDCSCLLMSPATAINNVRGTAGTLRMSNPEPIFRTSAAYDEFEKELPFYQPATNSQARPRCALKWSDCFAIIDSHGDIGATAGEPDGLFYADTRFLSQFQLLIEGAPPVLLGSNLRDD